MNLYSLPKVAFFFACTTLVLLIAATVALLVVEPLQRHTLTTVLSMVSGLDVQASEVADLQLLPSVRIVVKDLSLSSTGVIPKELFNAEQLSLNINPNSIFNDKWLITDLRVDGGRVDLSSLSDSESRDWFSETAGKEGKFETPVQINHWQFTNSKIVYRDDDQNIVLNVSSFEGETASAQTQIRLLGDLNGLPLEATGSVEYMKPRAEGSLKWGELSANFTADETQTSSVPLQYFNVSITAPSAKPLLGLLGAPEIRDGAFSLRVNIDRSTTSTDINVDGDLGDFRIDLASRIDDFTRLREFDFSYRILGPSLAEAGALFDFLDFPPLPFSITGSVTRQNKQVRLNRSVLEIGDGEFIVQGRLPNFPSIDGWQFDLEGDEFGLDLLRPFSGECDLPSEPYRWLGAFRTNDRGDESMNFLLEGAQRRLQIEGSIGQAPGYEGTHINVNAEGINLNRLGSCLGFDHLTDAPSQISAVLKKQGQSWMLSPITLVAEPLTVNATLEMGQLPGTDSVQFSFNATVDDLGKMFDQSGTTQFKPINGMSLSVEAKIEGTTSDLHLSHSRFLINDQPGTISGQLGDISAVEHLSLFFEFSGEDLWRHQRISEEVKLPFKLSGRIYNISQGWRFSDVLLKVGSADVTLNGLVSNHDNYFGSSLELGITGDHLSELLPPALSKDTLAQPIRLELSADYEEAGIDVRKLNVVIGSSKLDGRFFIDLPPDYQGTRGNISLEGSSTAEFFKLVGYESDFLDREFMMSAQLDGTNNQMSIEQLKINFGESDLTGRVSIDWIDVPQFDLDLQSTYLYMPYFFPELETIDDNAVDVNSSDMAEYEDELTAEERSERLIKDRMLPTKWMNLFEGEFSLSAEEVFFSENTTMQIDVDITMNDGTLRSRQFDWQGNAFEGHLDLEIDHQENGARYMLDITSSRLPIFWLFAGDPDQEGDSSYRARLTASGDSITSLLRNVDGKALFRSTGGKLHTNQLDIFFGDFFELATNRILGQKKNFTNVACIAGALNVNNGELNLSPGVVLRTDSVDINVKGKVNLAQESLELLLNTRSRKGIGISAMKTVSPRSRITGTFANPRYIFDATGAVASGTAAVATSGLTIVASGLKDRFLAKIGNPCKALYKKALNNKKFDYSELNIN